jgi:serine/threonine protein kinase
VTVDARAITHRQTGGLARLDRSARRFDRGAGPGTGSTLDLRTQHGPGGRLFSDRERPGRALHAGGLLGTPLYLAPEAITAPADIDHRADLYAVGAVGYELLTGTTVFRGATLVEVCIKHLHEEPIPPSQHEGTEMPPGLEALVLACLHKDPRRRPQSAAEIVRTLASISVDPAWSDERAAAWWRERGAAVLESARARRRATSVDMTVAVDLTARALTPRARG